MLGTSSTTSSCEPFRFVKYDSFQLNGVRLGGHKSWVGVYQISALSVHGRNLYQKKHHLSRKKLCIRRSKKKNSIETIYCWGLAAILRQKIYLIYPTKHIPNQSPKSNANSQNLNFAFQTSYEWHKNHVTPTRKKHLIFFHLYGTLLQLEGIGPPFEEPKLALCFVVVLWRCWKKETGCFVVSCQKTKNMPFPFGWPERHQTQKSRNLVCFWQRGLNSSQTKFFQNQLINLNHQGNRPEFFPDNTVNRKCCFFSFKGGCFFPGKVVLH